MLTYQQNDLEQLLTPQTQEEEKLTILTVEEAQKKIEEYYTHRKEQHGETPPTNPEIIQDIANIVAAPNRHGAILALDNISNWQQIYTGPNKNQLNLIKGATAIVYNPGEKLQFGPVSYQELKYQLSSPDHDGVFFVNGQHVKTAGEILRPREAVTRTTFEQARNQGYADPHGRGAPYAVDLAGAARAITIKISGERTETFLLNIPDFEEELKATTYVVRTQDRELMGPTESRELMSYVSMCG